jgi:hypothetical protein
MSTPQIPPDRFYTHIRDILESARLGIARTVNTAQVLSYYGISRRDDLKSYVGAVTLNRVGGEYTTTSILCENLQLGPFRPAAPSILGENQPPVCAPGTKLVMP